MTAHSVADMAMPAEKPDTLEVETVELKTPRYTTQQESFELTEHDQRIARRLRWKIDLWLLPIISIIYLLAAMDRSDIGNAQIVGMQTAIHASASQWANVVSLFYVGFVVGQPAGVFTLRKLTPQVVLGTAVLLWGTAICCMIVVDDASQAAGLRVVIGFCEGLDHAALLYLSLWYTSDELAMRSGIFYSTSSLAGAFNGLIAFGIVENYADSPPFQPWQWLFLVEGLLSISFGLVVLIFLPTVPERVRWGFTEDEKRLAVIRTQQANNTPGAKIRWKDVFPALESPMLWIYTVLLVGTQLALSGMSSFLPAIVESMGYSSVHAQLMTVPVYAIAFVSTLLFTYLSDRARKRGPFLVLLPTISMIGLTMLTTLRHNNAARYAGVCLTALGMYPSVMINLTWLAINTRNFTHRATASAVTNLIAQSIVAGVIQIFKTPPYYFEGLHVVLAMVALMIPTAAFGSLYVRWINQKKRKAIANNSPAASSLRARSMEELGSDHPDFFYEM